MDASKIPGYVFNYWRHHRVADALKARPFEPEPESADAREEAIACAHFSFPPAEFLEHLPIRSTLPAQPARVNASQDVRAFVHYSEFFHVCCALYFVSALEGDRIAAA